MNEVNKNYIQRLKKSTLNLGRCKKKNYKNVPQKSHFNQILNKRNKIIEE